MTSQESLTEWSGVFLLRLENTMTVGKHVLGTSRTTHMGDVRDSQDKAPEYTRQTQC